MVSRGTEASRAFWYIVRSVGLASGSPPPSRAATSTWRMSLAKSFPPLTCAGPLLCLRVAHLEWPLIAPAPGDSVAGPLGPVRSAHSCDRLSVSVDGFEEELVEPEVVGALRVEGREQARPLPPHPARES